MNKLHNALKTLNLTLEQRNELVKVLGELGGGGECLEIRMNIVSNEHKVYITINNHVFPIDAGNFNAYVTAEFNKFDIATALNINTLDDIFKYSHILIHMEQDEQKDPGMKTNANFCLLYQNVHNNHGCHDTLDIGCQMDDGQIMYLITVCFYTNSDKGYIGVNFGQINQ